MKKRMILWSGGMDSTYLIKKSILDGYDVIAYYINLKNNEAKTKMEIEAIKKMAPIFQKSYRNKFNYYGILSEIEILPKCSEHREIPLLLLQFPVWLFSSLYADLSHVDSIAFGYVMNDDAISYLKYFIKIWKSYKPLWKYDKMPVLEFPLSQIKKQEIVNDMEDLIEYCVYCEHPLIKENKEIIFPCLTCPSCKRHLELTGIVKEPDEKKKEEVVCKSQD